MKIKYKNGLRTERKTLRVLLACGTVSFLASLIIEILSHYFAHNPGFQRMHLGYLSNVLLGIAGSSFISWISLRFHYIDKRTSQINNIMCKLELIYVDYRKIYLDVFCEANDESTRDNYYMENRFLEKIIFLKSHIKELCLEYSNSDFSNETIEDTLKLLQSKIVFNLELIETFCNLFLDYKKSSVNDGRNLNYKFPLNNLLNEFDIEFGRISKDPIIKRAEKECYELLLKEIESNFSIQKLESQFLKLGINCTNIQCFFDELKNRSDDAKNVQNKAIEMAKETQMKIKIMEIKNKHAEQYDLEYEMLKSRVIKTIEKLDDNTKNDPTFLALYKMFFKLLENDEMQTAQAIVSEIEKFDKV